MKTKRALIAAINELVGTVGDLFDSDEDGDAERDFMAQRCPARLQAAVRELPTLSMHLMARIEEEPVSVVKLAARSGRLKGTVSKHVQRLVEAGLVKRTPLPGNRKEIQLTLTADGRLLNDAHRQLHEEMTLGLHDFLRRYSSAELQVLEKVLRDLASTQKVGVRITVPE
jgi:DNA-binding MarR family transcriptional regulator